MGVIITYDLYIGALGYEERTSIAAETLLKHGIKVNDAILLEFDMFFKATEKRREVYTETISKLTRGKVYRPLSAPVSIPDINYPEKLRVLIETLSKAKCPKILYDCTSCPSVINSETLKILFDYGCNLTILYTESTDYFPTLKEWESIKNRKYSDGIQGPYAGLKFVSKPPILQADDIGEFPILLLLFPTFNKDRTSGVLTDVDPATRVWVFGKPHNLAKNSYRIDMAKLFAAPIMQPGDPWLELDTFDYKKTLKILGSIYSEYRLGYRIVVMPHGSKMQTLGVNLFAAIHQISLVFATPRVYNPNKYSKGHVQVWGISLGEVKKLINRLKSFRVLGN